MLVIIAYYFGNSLPYPAANAASIDPSYSPNPTLNYIE